MRLINAYILVSMQPGNSDKAIQDMRKIEHVEKISVVAGEFDIVIRVRVETLDELLQATNEIQMIPGIQKTTTQVIEKEIAL